MLRFLRFYGLNIQNQMAGGFLGGSVIKNLPASARDMGFALWPGKIPHAAEQLNPVPELLSPRPEPVFQRRGTAATRRPGPATREQAPLTATRESPSGSGDPAQPNTSQ